MYNSKTFAEVPPFSFILTVVHAILNIKIHILKLLHSLFKCELIFGELKLYTIAKSILLCYIMLIQYHVL